MRFQDAAQFLISQGYTREKVTEFLRWCRERPAIWGEFERVALKAFQDGIGRWGAKGVAEVVRWNLRERKLGDFKFKNDYVHFFARIFVAKHPEARNFFEFREVGEKRKEAA